MIIHPDLSTRARCSSNCRCRCTEVIGPRLFTPVLAVRLGVDSRRLLEREALSVALKDLHWSRRQGGVTSFREPDQRISGVQNSKSLPLFEAERRLAEPRRLDHEAVRDEAEHAGGLPSDCQPRSGAELHVLVVQHCGIGPTVIQK